MKSRCNWEFCYFIFGGINTLLPQPAGAGAGAVCTCRAWLGRVTRWTGPFAIRSTARRRPHKSTLTDEKGRNLKRFPRRPGRLWRALWPPSDVHFRSPPILALLRVFSPGSFDSFLVNFQKAQMAQQCVTVLFSITPCRWNALTRARFQLHFLVLLHFFFSLSFHSLRRPEWIA